jgi:hypothetical protein
MIHFIDSKTLARNTRKWYLLVTIIQDIIARGWEFSQARDCGN